MGRGISPTLDPLYLYTWAQVQRELAKTPISQFVSGRGFTLYFPSCSLRVWFLIILHLVLAEILPFVTQMGLDIPSPT